MSDSESPTPAIRPNHGISNEDAKIVKWLCQDLGPFDILDNSGFRNYCKNTISNYTAPSTKKFLDELIPAQYKIAESKLKIKLQSVDNVAIALRKNKNYPNLRGRITVTLYYVHGGKFISQNLFTMYIPLEIKTQGKQQETRTKLTNHLREWGILDKIVCVISAEENVEIFYNNSKEIPRISCTHSILQKTFEKCMLLANDKLETVKKNRESCWKQLSMLKQLNDEKEGKCAELADCVNMLDYFRVFQNELSTKTQTLSNVIPLVGGLKQGINTYSPSSEWAQGYKDKILEAIDSQFGSQGALALKATFMDPRFTKIFLTEEQAVDVEQEVFKELSDIGLEIASTSSNNPPKENLMANDTASGKLEALMEEKVKNYMKDKNLNFPTEMIMRFEIPKIGLGEDPFQFWERHSHFKQLYNLSKKYLCIPATATSVESITGKGIGDHNRPKIVNQILFLHSFYSNNM